MTDGNAKARAEAVRNFDFDQLFRELLGWDRGGGGVSVVVAGTEFSFQLIAAKGDIPVLLHESPAGQSIPDRAMRLRIQSEARKQRPWNILIFIDAAHSEQHWQWDRRRPGRPIGTREVPYRVHSREQGLTQLLHNFVFPIELEDDLTHMTVVERLEGATKNADKVTKKFYDRFQKEHTAFVKFISGIPNESDQLWYASLMLNRLMFVYFIQKKSFLDNDPEYLQNRLERLQKEHAKDEFFSFYRHFLLRLFHDGLNVDLDGRETGLDALIGKIPYLNGGFFDIHQLEQQYRDIQIPDCAFARLFTFFDEYNWHLDDTPLKSDNEINPDVLGYIFEKYINQKQMGAYYTKEDITEYISKNTIVPWLFDAAKKDCAIAFRPQSALWKLLQDDPDAYIYKAVRHGVTEVIPAEIAVGIGSAANRTGWNRPATEDFALPTETWREYIARRQRYEEIWGKLVDGSIIEISDLITLNLDIRQFSQDVITRCEGPELLRAFYDAIKTITVLDPTCGSGAFLFAALNVLEPLYEACLDRMQLFLAELDASDEKHASTKFGDFRKELKKVQEHPNRHYYILKSIILNNLYGVDIMEEAVEICKLRLFLKLVSQIERVEDLEPLPDIDFNIRAGNTLVGYVTKESVESALTRSASGQITMDLDGSRRAALEKFNEDAEIADKAYKRFRAMQSDEDMDADEFRDAKRDVRTRLDALDEQLNRCLAIEYAIDPSALWYENWKSSHQPFHWFVEFFGIMRDGGFDAIIGNPPYIEYAKVREQYELRADHYQVITSGNLYAMVIERCTSLSSPSARLGMIVQLSAICTDRMLPLQAHLKESYSRIWASCFDDRPSKLFEGLEHIRATIVVAEIGTKLSKIFTTNLYRWYAEYRPFLFDTMLYGKIDSILINGSFPKAGDPKICRLLEKIKGSASTLGTSQSSRSKSVIYYYRSPLYWIRSMDFLPTFTSDNASRSTHHFKDFGLRDASLAPVVGSIINSSLFYVWFIAFGNGRNVALRDIETLPVPIELLGHESVLNFQGQFQILMEDYRKNSRIRTRKDRVTFQEFYPSKSKSKLDEIDGKISEYYGFTEEELDYIINYDIKYRMGRDAEVEDIET